jgi:hypothetical protein
LHPNELWFPVGLENMILIDTDQSVLIKPEHLGMKKQLFGGKKRCDSQEKTLLASASTVKQMLATSLTAKHPF